MLKAPTTVQNPGQSVEPQQANPLLVMLSHGRRLRVHLSPGIIPRRNGHLGRQAKVHSSGRRKPAVQWTVAQAIHLKNGPLVLLLKVRTNGRKRLVAQLMGLLVTRLKSGQSAQRLQTVHRKTGQRVPLLFLDH
jgi:hypothetical protein